MRSRRSKLTTLARAMRGKNQGQPIPVSGPLLDCLDHVLSDEELDLLLAIGPGRVAPSSAAARSGLPRASFEALVASLLRRDLLTADDAPDSPLELAPFLPGWMETQLADGGTSDWHREFARRVDRLFASWEDANLLPVRPLLNLFYRVRTRPFQTVLPVAPARTVSVEVNEPLGGSLAVLPSRTVLDLVARHGERGSLALIHCFCRQWRLLAGDPCRFGMPGETCLELGEPARRALARGIARPVGREEALALVEAAHRRGAVHTVFHEGDDADRPELAVCSCCWDCCGALGAWNRGGASLHLRAFARAEPVVGRCDGCGECERYCPTAAVAPPFTRAPGRGLGTASVRAQRCIGCGQCASKCPREALEMIACRRAVLLPMVPRSATRLAGRAGLAG